jgi:hypothetical protein
MGYKRDRCYHTVARDLSARPHEILGLKIKDVVFKRMDKYEYAETIVNGKTGSRQLPLIQSRISINNLFYCETVLSKTQAAYHSDQGHGQISISKPALMPNQLKDTIRNLQSQTVSQIRGHLETLTTGTLNEYLNLLQEIYQPNGLIGHLIQEELQTRGLGNGCIF